MINIVITKQNTGLRRTWICRDDIVTNMGVQQKENNGLWCVNGEGIGPRAAGRRCPTMTGWVGTQRHATDWNPARGTGALLTPPSSGRQVGSDTAASMQLARVLVSVLLMKRTLTVTLPGFKRTMPHFSLLLLEGSGFWSKCLWKINVQMYPSSNRWQWFRCVYC